MNEVTGPIVVRGALARFFACRDDVENWWDLTSYEISDPEDIAYALNMGVPDPTKTE